MSHRLAAAAAGAGSGGGRQCVRCLYLIFVLWSILCVSSQVEATKKSKFKKSHHKTTHPTPSPSPSPRPSPAPGLSPSPSPPGNSHGTVFDIRKTGAVGNGVQDDTQAILKAWNLACGCTGVAVVLIPAGVTSVLMSNTEFVGTKCSARIIFQVDGMLLGPKDKGSWTNLGSKTVHWIQFTGCSNFVLQGKGTLDARGQSFWANGGGGPTAIRFLKGTNVAVLGITLKNSPQVNLKFNWCTGGLVKGVTILCPGNSPNTDGIHLQTSVYNFVIEDCIIESGDDCISIQMGTYNLVVKNILCGPGHGISIGALGNKGVACVSNIDISNVIFTGTLAGARIKSWPNGMGCAKDVSYRNITVNNVQQPILVDQYYNSKGGSGGSHGVYLDNITFADFYGKASPNSQHAVALMCSPLGCNNIRMSNIHITASTGSAATAYCERAYGASAGTMYPSSCLQYGRLSTTSSNQGC